MGAAAVHGLLLCTCLCLLLAGASARPQRRHPRHDVLLPAPKSPTEGSGGGDSDGGDSEVGATIVAAGFAKWVNISSRPAVRKLFNEAYMAEAVDISKTGFSATKCTPGTPPAAYIQSTLRRINFFRSMAGVPANVTHNSVWGRKAQQMAMMLILNGDTEHFPPTSWKCYKKEGAEAAGKSNLSLGTHGPDAVDSQMRERKGSNYDVAHRRWLLYPNTPRMGVGGTDYFNEAFNYYGATAVWIIDDSTFSGPRPATRNKYVAWPPPGYVPYQVVWARWSFSYPGADFSAAKVTLRRGTTLLGVKREAPSGGSADNTLVWVANTQNSLYNEDRFEPWDKPTAVQKINVTITGVKVPASTKLRTFSYLVQIFDPAA